MPRVTRLLVAALAVITLALSPIESSAGPLQVAVHKVPPDWLSRTGPGPRQTRQGMSCAERMLVGLGIGAAAGVGLLVATPGRFSREAAIGVPLTFGGLLAAGAYSTCR
jgi:hypothetical protein